MQFINNASNHSVSAPPHQPPYQASERERVERDQALVTLRSEQEQRCATLQTEIEELRSRLNTMQTEDKDRVTRREEEVQKVSILRDSHRPLSVSYSTLTVS